MSDFDSPWKEALDLYFEPFLELILPAVHGEIDWSRGYEMLDKELQQIAPQAEEGRRFVDKLAKVWLNSGLEEWILIHVEVQTQDATDFGQRMFVYHCRLRDLYHKEVLSLAVLADDRPDWRPDNYSYECLKLCRVTFQFPIAKLLDLVRDERLLHESRNPFATVVLAHLQALTTRKAMEDRWRYKTQLIKNLFLSGMSGDDIRHLFRLIDWLMELPTPLDRQFWHEIKAFQKERQVPFITTPERIERAEGRVEGRAEGLKEATILALENRFGPVPPDILAEVMDIADSDLLRQAVIKILSGEPLEAIRSTWLPTRPKP